MATKTPGTWDVIPEDAVITATRKDLTLKGTFKGVTGEYDRKRLHLEVPPLGVLHLDARDGWDVTYEADSAGDVIRSAPIGTVWGVPMTFYPRIVRISEGFVSRQHERSEQPIILPISNFDSWDADAIRLEDPAYLADLVKNR